MCDILYMYQSTANNTISRNLSQRVLFTSFSQIYQNVAHHHHTKQDSGLATFYTFFFFLPIFSHAELIVRLIVQRALLIFMRIEMPTVLFALNDVENNFVPSTERQSHGWSMTEANCNLTPEMCMDY